MTIEDAIVIVTNFQKRKRLVDTLTVNYSQIFMIEFNLISMFIFIGRKPIAYI